MRLVDRRLEDAGLPPLTRSAWVEVDVHQLTHNARAIGRAVEPLELGVVVKADGYGHGLEAAARCAIGGGATWLCVATLGEALRLRSDGYPGRIFVLYPVSPHLLSTARDEEIHVTVSTGFDVSSLDAAAGVNVHIEVDTGMTRGGIGPAELDRLVREVKATPARLVGVWTHLAAPEDPVATDRQVQSFLEVTADLDVGVRHVSASGGILTADPTGQTLVRAGLLYYGYEPVPGVDLPAGVAPALEVKANPVRVATVEEGTGVGYSSTWRAFRRSRIATLPLGYADGWARSLSPGATALVGGVPCPLVGRISSDALMVDVTDVPDANEESEFCLLGTQGDRTVTADDVANLRGTISWEVLQQLGARLPRLYLADDEVVGARMESAQELLLTDGSPLAYRSV